VVLLLEILQLLHEATLLSFQFVQHSLHQLFPLLLSLGPLLSITVELSLLLAVLFLLVGRACCLLGLCSSCEPSVGEQPLALEYWPVVEVEQLLEVCCQALAVHRHVTLAGISFEVEGTKRLDLSQERHDLVSVVNLVVLHVEMRQAVQLFELLAVVDGLDDVS